MTPSSIHYALLWRRLLFCLALSFLGLAVSLTVNQGAALAAAALPGTTSSVAGSNTSAQALPASIKPATRLWLQQHPQSQPLATPARSATPLVACQQTENCSCPNTFAPSQYYQCQWFNGFWPFSGGVLSLTYAIDPNLPTNMQNWARSGANLWVNSAANVYYHESGTLSTANVEIDAEHHGANCNGVWGHTTPNGPPISHVHVYLNVDNAGCANNSGWFWITTAAHELGHAIGLEHNQWCSGGGTTGCMLMNSCGSCNLTPHALQSMDITITNAMYPPNLVFPTLTHSCGSNWALSVDQQAYSQSGVSNSTTNIPASMAFLNTWHVPAASGGVCNTASWSLSTVTKDIQLWVPSGFAGVTSMAVVIGWLDLNGIRHTSTVFVNESPYTGFYDLGTWSRVISVSIPDNQATPSGTSFGIGPLRLL